MSKEPYLWPVIAGISFAVAQGMIAKNPVTLKHDYGEIVERYCRLEGLDVNTVLAVILQESGGRPWVTGSTPDIGLMQVTQPALTDYNNANKTNYGLLDLYSVDINLAVGCWYLGFLRRRFNGVWEKYISAYNQGLGRVESGKYSTDYAESVAKQYSLITGESKNVT